MLHSVSILAHLSKNSWLGFFILGNARCFQTLRECVFLGTQLVRSLGDVHVQGMMIVLKVV